MPIEDNKRREPFKNHWRLFGHVERRPMGVPTRRSDRIMVNGGTRTRNMPTWMEAIQKGMLLVKFNRGPCA